MSIYHQNTTTKIRGGCKQDNPINVHTPYKQNDDTPRTKFVHTPPPLQASNSLALEVEGG